uniref:Uncharacterized protein n=1 Tax=Aegilops tauschii subsp. strangulata TaxID=200361 RepID=A0A453PR64_AEGTS
LCLSTPTAGSHRPHKQHKGRISFTVKEEEEFRRMASLLLRSAAGRVLGRSIPLGVGSFRRSPGRFLSGGAQRIESKARFEIALEKYSENLQKAHEATLSLLEQEKR